MKKTWTTCVNCALSRYEFLNGMISGDYVFAVSVQKSYMHQDAVVFDGVCRFTISFYMISLVCEYSNDFLSTNEICPKVIGDYVTCIY